MTRDPRVPPVSAWLLARAARRLDVPELVSDAEALFHRGVARHGRRAAVRWYRVEARRAVRQAASATIRSIRWTSLAGVPLDARLAFRMLRRYPGLTLVGGVAMAFAIFVGAVLFEFIQQTLPGRHLPIREGDRVVGMRLWDREASTPVRFTGAQLDHWRRSLSSVELLGGFAGGARLVTTTEGQARVEEVAVMSPAGFALAGVEPLLGRVFTDHDLEPGAGAIVVISFATWQALFDGSVDALGQRVKVGEEWCTVIGVMPAGFRFPITHSMWIPLTSAGAASETFRVFARLKGDAAPEHVEQEMLGQMAAMPGPTGAPDRLRPLVEWYRHSLFDRPVSVLTRVLVQQLNAFAALFLLLVAANIALLMFARAATRERELVVRGALGAGRQRIVLQFLIEAMALFGIATTVGLAAAGPGLAWVERRIGAMGGGTSPFWFSPTISMDTMVYAGALTIVAALMAGGVPALRATRQLTASRLQETGGGGGRLSLGGIWSVVVVIQIATTVIFTAGALLMWRQARLSGSLDANFIAADYVDVLVGGSADELPARRFERYQALKADLARLPGVSGVSMASLLPLMSVGATAVELEGASAPVSVSMPAVDVDFFDVFGAPLLSGRGFVPADRVTRTAVIVDQAFVEEFLGGRPAVGQRVRLVASESRSDPGPWLEIVGTVRTLEPPKGRGLYLDNQRRPFVYRVSDAVGAPAVTHLVAHMPGADRQALLSIRERVTATDAAVTVHEVQTLERAASAERAFWRFWAELILIASVVTLLLALAGVYAVMSFSVTRRVREIGIRMALGARGSRVAYEVLRGPLRHVGTGIALGCAVVAGLYWTVTGHVMPSELGALLAFAAGIAGVCAAACLEPARRALSVQPSRSLGDQT